MAQEPKQIQQILTGLGKTGKFISRKQIIKGLISKI